MFQDGSQTTITPASSVLNIQISITAREVEHSIFTSSRARLAWSSRRGGVFPLQGALLAHPQHQPHIVHTPHHITPRHHTQLAMMLVRTLPVIPAITRRPKHQEGLLPPAVVANAPAWSEPHTGPGVTQRRRRGSKPSENLDPKLNGSDEIPYKRLGRPLQTSTQFVLGCCTVRAENRWKTVG